MRKISIKGVLIGGVLDVVLSAILGVPLVIFVIASRGIGRLPKDQMRRALVMAIHGTPSLYAVQLFIGAISTVLGGFVAARLARHDHILNGLLSSAVCMAIGVYSIMTGKSSEPLVGQLVLLLVITPLCGATGGYLAQPRPRSEPAANRP